MTTIAIALGEDCIYTYKGTGLNTVEKFNLPQLVYSADLTYDTMYAQANAYVDSILTGATKILCSNADGIGTRNAEGETVVARAPADVKGFATVGNDALRVLILRLIGAKAVTIPALTLKIDETVYRCMRCGVVNSGGSANGAFNRKLNKCGHFVPNGAQQAFAMWHTLDSVIPEAP